MLGGGDPVQNGFGERLGGHAAMRRHHDCDQALLSAGHQRLHIAAEHGLERLLGLPFRVPRRHRPDFVEGESQLEIERLFAPQRAVIVECGDAQLGRHEIRRARCGHAGYEVGDGFLHRAVVPGRQRIGRGRGGRGGLREGRTPRAGKKHHRRQRRGQQAAAAKIKPHRRYSNTTPGGARRTASLLRRHFAPWPAIVFLMRPTMAVRIAPATPPPTA